MQFSQKVTRHTKKQESVTHIGGKNASNTNFLREGLDVRFNKDFKEAIIKIFNVQKPKETMHKEVSAAVLIVLYQIDNINKETKIIKINKMEPLRLKHSVIEVKNISREGQQMSLEERISKVEGKLIGNLKNSKKKNEGNQHNLREMWGNIKAQD